MGLITNFIRESCITVVNKLYNVQETTFFRSFLTTFFLPQTLFGGGTERSPGRGGVEWSLRKVFEVQNKWLKMIEKRWFPER